MYIPRVIKFQDSQSLVLIRRPTQLCSSNRKQCSSKMDEYTENTVKVSKMFLGFLIFVVSLNVDNTCDDQKQLPYWVYAISLHMGLLTLLDTYLIFVTPTNQKAVKK